MTPALEARNLKKHYRIRRGPGGPAEVVQAVDGVDLLLEPGRTLGLVGESGSGKSTIARMLVRLEEPTSGEILLHGEDFLALEGEALRRRRREIQLVFQETGGSLHPGLTVGATLAEPLRAHGIAEGREAERVAELLETVGLDPAHASRRPAALSGGERQRVGIARALATEPSVLVADEPVSALDVSVRAQIVNLLVRLQDRLGLALLFVAHDLAVVEQVAHRIAVLERGRIVEEGEPGPLLAEPRHPKTAALVSAARRTGGNISPRRA